MFFVKAQCMMHYYGETEFVKVCESIANNISALGLDI